MVTENQANEWLGQQVGQHLDYDHQYGQQCVDFFNFYYQFITGDNPYADGYGVDGAKDLWNIPNDRFDKIPDSNNLIPNVGDVLIYGPSWGGGYGHVEVCRWSDDGGCHAIGENEHNNANEGVVEVYRSWASMRGLIGVMRPRFAPEPQPAPVETPEPAPAPVVVPDPLPEPVPIPEPGTVVDPTPEPTSQPAPPVKVVVPEPSQHFSLWELIIAILQKIFKTK